MNQPALHGNIQNLVALGAAIASKCLKQAWLLEKELLAAGVPQYQIDQAVEIAARVRDQAHANTVALFRAGPQALIDGISQLEVDKSAPCDCEDDSSCCAPAAAEKDSACCSTESASHDHCCDGDEVDVTRPGGCCC